MPRGRARSPLLHLPTVAELPRSRRLGGGGALTPRSAACPRPPPPAAPHLRHVSARAQRHRPPIYRASSAAPGPPRSASPIGGECARPPAPQPIRRFDWLTPPPLDDPPASKHAPTALPFVERCYWLVGLQEVLGDWLAEGRPLKCGRALNGSLARGAVVADRAVRAAGWG